MAFSDEVIIRMGLDASGVKSGLSKLPAMMKGIRAALGVGALLNFDALLDSGRKAYEELKNIFGQFGSFLGGFSVGGLQEGQRAMEEFINRAAVAAAATAKARKANEERWAAEKKVLDDRNESIERGNKLLEANQKIKNENREAQMSLAGAISTNEQELKLEKEKLEAILKAGESREEYAKQERIVLDINTKLTDLKAQQLDLEERLTKEKLIQLGAEARKQNDVNDAGKMTLREIASSTAPGLQGDRAKAQKALGLRAQAEQARLNGDEKGFKSFTEQADKITRGDPGSLTRFDRQKIADAERFKGTTLEGVFNARAQDALGRLNGIGSAKESEKDSGLKQAVNELQTIRNEITTINKRIEKLGTN